MPRRYSTRSARAPQHNNVVAGGARGDSGLPRRDRSIDRSIASARVTLTVVTHATKARVPHTRARATHTDRHDCDTRSPLATRRSDRVVTRDSSIASSHDARRCAALRSRLVGCVVARLVYARSHRPRLTDRGKAITPRTPGNPITLPTAEYLEPRPETDHPTNDGRSMYPAGDRYTPRRSGPRAH